jgi:hypothetical protein
MTDSLTSFGALPRRCRRPGVISLLFCALSVACGSGHDRPPPAPADGEHLNNNDLSNYDSSTGDARDNVSEGECENGATKTCRVYLPAHDGIQPCFVGEQLCVETRWSSCDDAVLVDANAGDATLDPGDPTSP